MSASSDLAVFSSDGTTHKVKDMDEFSNMGESPVLEKARDTKAAAARSLRSTSFEFSRRDAPRRSGCRCQHLANQHDLDEMAPPVDSLNAHDAPIQWIRADLG